jgi:hypothetical protein
MFFVFLLAFRFDPSRFWFSVGRSFGRSAAEGGRSAGAWRTVRGAGASLLVLCVFNRRSAEKAGRSEVLARTVRGSRPDSPRGPSRTVRSVRPDGPPEAARFASWFDSSPSSFVLPRVIQGIVPKARGCSITSLSWRLVCDSIHRSCVTGI